MSNTDNNRFEVKFVAVPSDMGLIQRWIGLHAAGFSEAYPQRRVNNLYFDTTDLDAYAENLSGISRRQKYRLRWYNDDKDVAFEVKKRRNRLVFKDVEKIKLEDDWQDMPYARLLATVRKNLSNPLLLGFNQSDCPVLINGYDRQYFADRSNKVRITIDNNMAFYDQRMSLRPNVNRKTRPMDIIVVEAKFSDNDHKEAMEILRTIPLRHSRNSKYVTGVNMFLGR